MTSESSQTGAVFDRHQVVCTISQPEGLKEEMKLSKKTVTHEPGKG